MDDKTKASYEKKSTELRAKLKKWESDWASSHNGSKPGRQDIRDNSSIAAIYKEYNKTLDIVSGKIPQPAKKPSTYSKKRRSDPPLAETPQKKNKYTETPIKKRPQEEENLLSTPATSRKLFSPAPLTCIGPTPQRNGKVLGLFDFLAENELETPPSKRTGEPLSTPGRHRNLDTTPSKRRGSIESEKLGRTPMSSSKRFMLDSFMTPLKNRSAVAASQATAPGSGPNNSHLDDTPSFLRRQTLPPALPEDLAFDAVAPLRLLKKPLAARGLSEIIAGLRQLEDDKLDDDDDMAALREAEAADDAASAAAAAPTRPSTAPTLASKNLAGEEEMLAPDYNIQLLPLSGFHDDEAAHDGPDEARANSDQPQVAYKKKGQKRTTRLVKMRPTIMKRPVASLDASQDVVLETQPLVGDENGGGLVGHDVDLSESDYNEDGNKKKKKEKKDSKSKSKKAAGQKESVAKKSLRKVNELAHANFTRLKLKSKNPKGRRGGGFGRRFGSR